MIRSSRHILKYQTQTKSNTLDQIWSNFEVDLKHYLDLILTNKLPLERNLSSKLLPINIIKHSQWRQVIYKSASEIVRSQIKSAEERRYKTYKFLYSKCLRTKRHKNFTNKRFKELNLNPIRESHWFKTPEIKSFSISIDQRLFDIDRSSVEFDEFIKIKSPYFHTDKKIAITIKLPIRHHKHSLKFKSWTRKKTIRLVKVNNQYHFDFVYEKEPPPLRPSGHSIGIDLGYNKLLACSDGQILGEDLKSVYNKIYRRQKKSKSRERSLRERTILTNQAINKLDLTDINHIKVEDLDFTPGKGKKTKQPKGKLHHWIYSQALTKLGMFCEENGILFTKRDPAYTSQACSACDNIDKSSLHGEIYWCVRCSMLMGAHLNASINIDRRGDYNPSRAGRSDLIGFDKSG